MTTIEAIGPAQINGIGATASGDAKIVTVTYPVGGKTVLSVQPDGSIQTRQNGTAGPFELAVLKGDRLIYAPLGAAGRVFLMPYTAELPNT